MRVGLLGSPFCVDLRTFVDLYVVHVYFLYYLLLSRKYIDFPNFDTPIDSKPNKKKRAADMGLGVKAKLIDHSSDKTNQHPPHTISTF